METHEPTQEPYACTVCPARAPTFLAMLKHVTETGHGFVPRGDAPPADQELPHGRGERGVP